LIGLKQSGLRNWSGWGKKHDIVTKSNRFDLVTEVDKLSEQMIMEFIHECYPAHTILSEESGITEHNSEYTWVVDPLDGTTNYSHGFPIFGISIALRKAEETILGVVYAPRLDELFYATRGGGAFLNGEKIQVSDCERLDQALLGTGFPYNREKPVNNLAQFNHILPIAQGVRRPGSAAYDLCCVASGRFDGYWEYHLHPWDVAAGWLIVQESGGRVVDISTPATEIALVAGNPQLCSILLNELARVPSPATTR
jgi:myo-inositol-1(or 4)-monophosphatase